LASGFLVSQRIGRLDYFRGVQERLEKAGHVVLTAEVGPLASADARARRLAQAINRKFGVSPVHIIAHSMGGLDCRVMIGRDHGGLKAPGRVLSLTTLSTPHRGSPVADLLAGSGPDDVRRKFFDVAARLGVDVGALRDLTSDIDEGFPDVATECPYIPCRSYATSGRVGSRPTARSLMATHDYVKAKTGEDNDGVVTVSSAMYGEFKGAWPCDHIQAVGYDLDTLFLFGKINQLVLGVFGSATPEFLHLAKFDEIVGDLAQIERNRPR